MEAAVEREQILAVSYRLSASLFYYAQTADCLAEGCRLKADGYNSYFFIK
jgi:hypothetical protein